MMNVKKFFAAVAVAAALAGAASPASGQASEGVAAIVNDHVISTFDVRQRAGLLMMSAGIDQPTPEMRQRAGAQALRDLIDEALQLEAARRFEVAVSEQDIDRRLAEIARQNETDVAGLQVQLTARGVSLSTLRAQIQSDVAWTRLMGGLYGSRVRVSDAEVTATQNRIAANLTRPQYLLSEIFLPAENEREFNEMEQGGMRLLQEMQRGAPFPAVARQFSAAPSAAAGGDIGWIASTELAPELQPIAERLQQGQVSLPVRTPTGVYIIAMRDRRAGGAAGANAILALVQVTAPAARRGDLERVRRREEGCTNIAQQLSNIQGATSVELGQSTEADLSPTVRARVAGLGERQGSEIVVNGEQADFFIVCARSTGGEGVPDRREIEGRLREQELNMLAERYLRNLRREATIITR